MDSIGNISNYYGGLYVWKENGKFYWNIEQYGDNSLKALQEEKEEISESLYKMLIAHDKKIQKQNALKSIKEDTDG